MAKRSKSKRASRRRLRKIMSHTHEPSLKRSLRRNIKNAGKGRGSRTRGWRAEAPQAGRPRTKLMRDCGPSCFLLPKEEKFPVCRKVYRGSPDCRPKCAGVTSALVRARQYGYKKVAKKAKALEKKLKCSQKSKRRSRKRSKKSKKKSKRRIRFAL